MDKSKPHSKSIRLLIDGTVRIFRILDMFSEAILRCTLIICYCVYMVYIVVNVVERTSTFTMILTRTTSSVIPFVALSSLSYNCQKTG